MQVENLPRLKSRESGPLAAGIGNYYNEARGGMRNQAMITDDGSCARDPDPRTELAPRTVRNEIPPTVSLWLLLRES